MFSCVQYSGFCFFVCFTLGIRVSDDNSKEVFFLMKFPNINKEEKN